MTTTISGTTGITVPSGSASAPSEAGSLATTAGISYPAANVVQVSTNSTAALYIGAAQQIGLGGANYGTSGQVITSSGPSSAPVWGTGTGSKAANVQTFLTSGTWTKPTGYGANAQVHIQAWGGGGSGSKNTGYGGGGGGYNDRWIALSLLGATETITIGAGGAASTTAIGNTGGTTSMGTWCLAYGGGGGSTTSAIGGGGGGQLSAGTSTGVNGDPWSGLGSIGYIWGGLGGLTTIGNPSVWGGGGGGSLSAGTTNAGGTSSYAGAGGTGNSSTNGGNGTQPSGGGGGTNTGTSSGAGGAGQVIVTVFDGA